MANTIPEKIYCADCGKIFEGKNDKDVRDQVKKHHEETGHSGYTSNRAA